MFSIPVGIVGRLGPLPVLLPRGRGFSVRLGPLKETHPATFAKLKSNSFNINGLIRATEGSKGANRAESPRDIAKRRSLGPAPPRRPPSLALRRAPQCNR